MVDLRERGKEVRVDVATSNESNLTSNAGIDISSDASQDPNDTLDEHYVDTAAQSTCRCEWKAEEPSEGTEPVSR